MTEPQINLGDIAALNALAKGIIPPDVTDGGAAMVFAGLGAADKFRQGINARFTRRDCKPPGFSRWKSLAAPLAS